MKIQLASKFSKDLRKIKDQKLLSEIKLVVNQCKLVQTLDDIKSLKKLQGYQAFYRIKIDKVRSPEDPDLRYAISYDYLSEILIQSHTCVVYAQSRQHSFS